MAPKLKVQECPGCRLEKLTAEFLRNSGFYLCFDCAEETYQTLAAHKSREIVMRCGSGKTGAIMPIKMEAG